MAVAQSRALGQKCCKALDFSAAFHLHPIVVICSVRPRTNAETPSHRKSLPDPVILSHRSVLTFEYLQLEPKTGKMSSTHITTWSSVIMSAEVLYEFGLCDGHAMDYVSQKSPVLRGSAHIESRLHIWRNESNISLFEDPINDVCFPKQ